MAISHIVVIFVPMIGAPAFAGGYKNKVFWIKRTCHSASETKGPPGRLSSSISKRNRNFCDAHHSRIAAQTLYIGIDYRSHPCRTASLTGPAGSPSQGVSGNGYGPKAGTSTLLEATITRLSARARLGPKPL